MNETHHIEDDILINAGSFCFDVEEDKTAFKNWLRESADEYGMTAAYVEKACKIVDSNDAWCTDNEDDVNTMVAAFNTPLTKSEDLQLDLANMQSKLTVYLAYADDAKKAVIQKAINSLYFLSEEV